MTGGFAGVDVGGTFTDVVAVGRDGSPRIAKVPTRSDQARSVVDGLEVAGAADVGVVAHGTTTATNAVLERAVARTVLVVTEGFADLLVIGRQHRPSLYDLSVVRPEPLVPRGLVVTVAERGAPDGSGVVALTDREIERVRDEVRGLEPEAVAVCLLFAWAGVDHERRLVAELRGALSVPVTAASELLAEFREYERCSTAVLNAALAPVMRRYLSRLDETLDAQVSVMTSGGGTVDLARAGREPVSTLLSGPAAGVVAAGRVAEAAGFGDALAFDMGGTSTDVCLVTDGQPQVRSEAELDGLVSRLPAVAVHTVGAGGGSIAWLDAGGALRVGPRSAGAEPGPACYGQGGTAPTVTDAHCVLGHLDTGRELGGGLRLDRDAAERALAGLGLHEDPAVVAGDVLAVVHATMTRALRRVSVEQGVDPAGLVLVAYGGAGPLSATALARSLGCSAVLVPPTPGVLSALGLLLAPARREVSRTVLGASGGSGGSGSSGAAVASVWEELETRARDELAEQRAPGDVTCTRLADVRYAGQSHELRIAAAAPDELGGAFAEAHRAAYGYALDGRDGLPEVDVEVVTLRVVARAEPLLVDPPREWRHPEPAPARERRVGAGEDTVLARVVDRASLRPDDLIEGPALIEQADTTTLLAPDEQARTDELGNLVVRWS